MNKTAFRISLMMSMATLITLILSIPFLPDQVPMHYGIDGEVDDMGSKYELFILGVLPFVLLLLLQWIPRLDPRKTSYQQHTGPYSIFSVVIIGFISFIALIPALSAWGFEIKVPLLVQMATAVILFVSGNYMGKIQPNYTFGIRTPWTLESEETWRRTHRLGGYLFVAISFVFVITAFLPTTYDLLISIGVLLCGTLYLVIYSYIDYRSRENGVAEEKE
ncbi:SdpI family protein [Mechercharimyces sp. CAU 1602]|uniref:SdpI family protein n=1 Tax=Mechercharimyces sp. CAU 1602 TaxID=2973933 RepID=UPI002161E9AB|nr:SdpI family protein [Mechercharimyces sp. CAU 1602]MCS1351269.1 SdpI family protein [Mechercharimyces sp. CAU 1602]